MRKEELVDPTSGCEFGRLTRKEAGSMNKANRVMIGLLAGLVGICITITVTSISSASIERKELKEDITEAFSSRFEKDEADLVELKIVYAQAETNQKAIISRLDELSKDVKEYMRDTGSTRRTASSSILSESKKVDP
jgi:hypothetical protein